MITAEQLFPTQNAPLDFSSGVLDVADVFNNKIATPFNELLDAYGVNDPEETEDISNRAAEFEKRSVGGSGFEASLAQDSQQDLINNTELSDRGIEGDITDSVGLGADPVANQPFEDPFANQQEVQTFDDFGLGSDDSSTFDPDAPKGASHGGNASASNLTDFVKGWEGFFEDSYADGRQRSIGYGTKAKKGETRISKPEAERRLQAELKTHRTRVENLNRSKGYNFSPAQLDALTSFDYNTGSLEQLTDGGKRSKAQIADAILLYNKADLDGKGLKPLRGLTRRRKAEAALFKSGYPSGGQQQQQRQASSGPEVSATAFRDKYNGIVRGGTSAQKKGGLEYLHPEMRSNFDALMSNAPKEITSYLRINSAYRDVDKQKSIVGGQPRATVATPGRSMHQYGLAIDLGNPKGGLLKASNSERERKIVDWLHKNAPKYGLTMRLSHHSKNKGGRGSLVEDWQIEHVDAFKIAPTRNVNQANKYKKLAQQLNKV